MPRKVDSSVLLARLVGAPLAISQRGLDALWARLERGAVGISVSAPKAGEVTADGIAIVPVDGELVLHADEIDEYFGLKGYSTVEDAIKAALADRDVKGVLLDFNSPGGQVAGCFELAEKIKAWSSAKDGKPIHALVDPLACSAAYLLAASTSRITIPRAGDVGSVGVVQQHIDQSGFDQKLGIKRSFMYAGAKKLDGSPHAPLSDSARADRQSEIDAIYSMFVKSVAANRDLTQREVRETEAGTFMGEAAVKAKLADQVGTLDDALASLRAEIKRRGAVSFQKNAGAKLAAIAALSVTSESDEQTLLAAIDTVVRVNAEYVKANAELSAQLKAQVDRSAALHAKSVDERLQSAKERAAAAGSPLEPETLQSVKDLMLKGDEPSEKLATQILKLATRDDGKPKPFARLENPGAKKAADLVPADKSLQAEMLSQMGFELTAEGAVVKKK